MRVSPKGLCAALGGLIMPGAKNYDSILDEYFGFHGRPQSAKRIAGRLQIDEGVFTSKVATALRWYPFSEQELRNAVAHKNGRRYLWPDEQDGTYFHPLWPDEKSLPDSGN